MKAPWEPDFDELPTVIPADEREWFLCPESDKNAVCPLSLVPKPGGTRGGAPHPQDNGAANPPLLKRLCGAIYHHDKRVLN